MGRLNKNNYSPKVRVTIQILLSLAMVGVIFIGYAISEDNIQVIDKIFNAEQGIDDNVPASQIHTNIKKGPPITSTRG